MSFLVRIILVLTIKSVAIAVYRQRNAKFGYFVKIAVLSFWQLKPDNENRASIDSSQEHTYGQKAYK